MLKFATNRIFFILTLLFLSFGLQAAASTTLVNSGKCIDDLGWATADNSPLGLYACDGSQNQSYNLTKLSNGNYTIQNAYSKLCMDDLSWSTTAGTKVAQYKCDGYQNQEFTLQSVSGGQYKLVGAYSHLCVDTQNESTASGAVLVQNTCNSSGTQIFAISGVTGPSPAPTASATATPNPTPTASPVPSPSPISGSGYASKHVFILVLENRSDAEALQYMPYMMSVAKQYTIGSQAYSPSHGSFLAYLELATGAAPKNGAAYNGPSNPNCNGDGCSTSSGSLTPYVANSGDNMVREVMALGLTFRGYFQTMPSTGYMGYTSGYYVRRHNPMPFLSEVYNSTALQGHMVPWTGNLSTDLASGNVANYTWLVPDLTHDGHNPSDTATALANADAYMKQELPALLNSKYFQPGGDGVLFITFDESDLSGDNACSSTVSSGCGGHIFFAAIGPNVKKNYTYTAHMMQNTMLRATCDLLGITHCPGDGASASGLSAIFQ